MNNSGADLLLGTMCFGMVFNVLVSVPVGGLIGHLAKGRWREGAGLGFLIGPLGWLVILAFSDKKRRCQDCRGVVPAGARKCLHCGATLVATPQHSHAVAAAQAAKQPAAAPVPQQPSLRSVGGERLCGKCNVAVIEEVELGEKVIVCPQCGSRWRAKRQTT